MFNVNNYSIKLALEYITFFHVLYSAGYTGVQNMVGLFSVCFFPLLSLFTAVRFPFPFSCAFCINTPEFHALIFYIVSFFLFFLQMHGNLSVFI